MNTHIDGSSFSNFYNFFFNLFLGFCDHFFNSCRVNSAVSYQLMK